ncbi:60S ribosomal protein l9, partial [Phtheirospermum japonicum]
PAGVKIKVKAKLIEVEGPRGKLSRRKTTAAIRTVLSHVSYLINGVTKGYRYKMRFVYAHFPINASITNNGTAIEIRNFLGEKKAPALHLIPKATPSSSGQPELAAEQPLRTASPPWQAEASQSFGAGCRKEAFFHIDRA